jgi:formylmethanofuran dehydrogenase subunit E
MVERGCFLTMNSCKEQTMTGEEIVRTDEFKKCLDFHGHLCPGLSIGYRAAKAGLEWLAENRSADEELVAIVENDACGCDAVQVMTGCTFGKGNFIFKDHGKQVFTFFGRKSGKAVRVSLKPDALAPSERHRDLIQKMRNKEASEEEQEEFRSLHEQGSYVVLERPAEELFKIEPIQVAFPPHARIHASNPCDRCGEMTMATRLEEVGGEKICRDCKEAKP